MALHFVDKPVAAGNRCELCAADIFECQKCGEWCKGYGGTYVSEKDIQAIATYIGVSREHFAKTYCRISCGKPLLAQGEDGCCIFWDQLCTIHPVKPMMCKAWPFIESILRDPENWKVMATVCPGIRPDVPRETLLKIVKAERLKLEQNN
jgi:Fe-S-cluster containining protein